MIGQGTFRRALAGLLVAFAVGGVLTITPGGAQDPVVRFPGRVSWIAGETLVVSTEDSVSVRIDLSQVDQDEYQRLTSGDRVIVTGIIPDERDRVVATSIEPLTP
jgi:hypothetical protein